MLLYCKSPPRSRAEVHCLGSNFDADCKLRAFAIVESVRAALEERLQEVDWMTSEETRIAKEIIHGIVQAQLLGCIILQPTIC